MLGKYRKIHQENIGKMLGTYGKYIGKGWENGWENQEKCDSVGNIWKLYRQTWDKETDGTIWERLRAIWDFTKKTWKNRCFVLEKCAS